MKHKLSKVRDVNINNYGKHEITNEIDFLVKLLLPRAIIPISKPNNKDVDLPKVSMLLRSSNDSWIEMSSLNQYPKYNELDGDILGPIHVGVAIERGSCSGIRCRDTILQNCINW